MGNDDMTQGFHIEATEIIKDGVVTGYKVTIPEFSDNEACCEKLEEIIPTGCALRDACGN